MPIHFGTDGWRAVISDTFTFDNLRIVTQAIADAVASEHWDKSANGGPGPDPKKIVVGFRHPLPIRPVRRRSGARPGRQRIHRLAGPVRCANPGHFVSPSNTACRLRA